MDFSDFIVDGLPDACWTVMLAHGAGQPADSVFLRDIAEGLTRTGDEVGGIRVLRFDFPYMAAARATGRKRVPDREPVLLESWREAIRLAIANGAGIGKLVIGGKSLGGRIASMVAQAQGVAGLVCLGYPFHPPGKPERLRTAHLLESSIPTLICQGARDPFGTADEVPGYQLPDNVRLHWLADGDHGFKPRKSSGRTMTNNLNSATGAIVRFLEDLAPHH